MKNITLPQKFINEMPTTKPLYSVIYIYGLSLCEDNKAFICVKTVAQHFNVLETDVVYAWQYWQAKMFVHLTFGTKLSVEFIDNTSTIIKKEVVVGEEVQQVKDKKVFYTKPIYSPQELELYKKNHDIIDYIFTVAERLIAHPLNANELSTIYGFYDWLRLPIDVIETLITYCVENGHRNINYIEKVALDWAENEVNSLEKVDEHIKNFNKNYKEVLKAMGQANRNITPKEITYINKWINEYNQSLEIILEACDKTIISLGKPSFTYTDTILKTWYNKGIKTIEQIASSEENYKLNKSSSIKTIPKKSSKFSNFTPAITNYSDLEKISLSLVKNIAK